MSRLADIPLSVLELAPVVAGSTATSALRQAIELAQAAEGLGYLRYWFAEHHGLPGVASAAPAVMAGQVAARTDTIRVGSGGVMLANHPPLVVAEQFGTLEALYPGRVDLGVGRASGASAAASELLRRPHVETGFAGLLTELMGYFAPDEDATVRAVPVDGASPELWVLGSTTTSAQLAGSLGLPYSFAQHLKPRDAVEAVRVYRDCFTPGVLPVPKVMLSVAAILGDSDEHAHWLAGPTKLKWIMKRRGESILLPTPEEAERYPYTEAERTLLATRFGPSGDVIIGSAETARRRLGELVDAVKADELMITTRVHGHTDRLRSYQLLAGSVRAPTHSMSR